MTFLDPTVLPPRTWVFQAAGDGTSRCCRRKARMILPFSFCFANWHLENRFDWLRHRCRNRPLRSSQRLLRLSYSRCPLRCSSIRPRRSRRFDRLCICKRFCLQWCSEKKIQILCNLHNAELCGIMQCWRKVRFLFEYHVC